MQSRISHLLSLVMQGNHALRTGSPLNFDESAFGLPDNGVQFAHLYDMGRGWEADQFASNSHEWIEKLRAVGCQELRAFQLPSNHPELADWKTAALAGGGGRWQIGALCSYGRDHWEPVWKFLDSGTHDNGCWLVQYQRVVRADLTPSSKTLSIRAASTELAAALEQARAFAQRQDLPDFALAFESGLATLKQLKASSSLVFRSELLKTRALALGSACETTWVFGAMGSWNDHGFAEKIQAEYEQVSARLYAASTSALIAVTNSTARQKWWQRWRS